MGGSLLKEVAAYIRSTGGIVWRGSAQGSVISPTEDMMTSSSFCDQSLAGKERDRRCDDVIVILRPIAGLERKKERDRRCDDVIVILRPITGLERTGQKM